MKIIVVCPECGEKMEFSPEGPELEIESGEYIWERCTKCERTWDIHFDFQRG
jgi:hypothetical protein